MNRSTHIAPRGDSAGFTLLEMLVAVALLAVMLLAVGFTSQKVSDSFQEGTSVDALNTRLHRTIEKLLAPLEEAQATGIGPQPFIGDGHDQIDYARAVAYDGGIQLGPPTRVVIEMDPNELDDGVDNDRDGLVDEGDIVWIQDPDTPDEIRTTICRGVPELLEGEQENNLDDNGNGLVDEPGMSFDLVGGVLTLRLTVQAQDPGGRLLTRTAVSSVRVRN